MCCLERSKRSRFQMSVHHPLTSVVIASQSCCPSHQTWTVFDERRDQCLVYHYSQTIYHYPLYSLHMIWHWRGVFPGWTVTCLRYHISLQSNKEAKERTGYCYGSVMWLLIHCRTCYLICSLSLCAFRAWNAASPGNWKYRDLFRWRRQENFVFSIRSETDDNGNSHIYAKPLMP